MPGGLYVLPFVVQSLTSLRRYPDTPIPRHADTPTPRYPDTPIPRYAVTFLPVSPATAYKGTRAMSSLPTGGCGKDPEASPCYREKPSRAMLRNLSSALAPRPSKSP